MSQITPYSLLNTIMRRYNKTVNSKTMGRDLHICKIILNTFRSYETQDYEIAQLVQYVCSYVQTCRLPQNFQYTATILLNLSRQYVFIKQQYRSQLTLSPEVQEWITKEISKCINQ